ncbi:hypothetical protein O5O45_26970 [Hahella aquimaris]|uniref:hypothetical protein n=1 Tax=Hahella sp. HNIBRBA332 TaxID=3015983 RepID=UPI00273B35ED|nr:hypothetical protein [Hahella sp. HNIBRBA332]WLQ13371.1 hypothetical protein O5O45_26970 [Hahella sp. HNIBRBA332]
MRWLKRLKASKMNPLGPDFSSAPWVEFNLSGKKLRFLCPTHEMSGPFKKRSELVNLYQDDLYRKWTKNNTGMSLSLISTGWKFWDRPMGEGALAYLNFEVRLNRRDPHYREIDSLLNPEEMVQWLLTYNKNMWGEFNKGLLAHPERQAMPVDPERGFWRYPKAGNDIKRVCVNGVNWFSYVVDMPNRARERVWHTAITEDHELAFDFETL